MTIRILILFAGGCVIGLLIRDLAQVRKWVGKLTNISIYCLLFLLGVSVASTPGVSDNLLSLGIPSLILAFFGVMGSCILAKIAHRWVGLDR